MRFKYPSPLCLTFLLLSSASLTGALNMPSDVTATTAGPATIAISWTDNEPSEDNYVIQRDDGGWTTLAELPANSTYYYDRGLAPGSTHTYRVQATSSGDASVAVESGSATTLDYQPNIIFFLADDMGYKDIVALRNEAIDGPTIYETPNLDSLVETAALTFTNTYCSGPRCVVARRSMQTGKYDWRPEAVPNNDYYVDKDGNPIGGGLWAGGTTVAGSESGAGVPIPFDNETYGEAMQAAGYRTCFIGKYHLGESAPTLHTPTGYSFGDQPGRGPVDQGYDVSIAAGHAGAPPASYFAVLNQNAGAAPGEYTFELPDLDDTSYMLPADAAAPANGDYITDRLTDKAIGFIDDAITNHSSQPFHLTLAHYAVHTPMEAKVADIDYFKAKKSSMSAKFADHPAGGSGLITDYSSKTRVWQDNIVYAAMMKSYDDSFGELWAYLESTSDPRNPGKMLSETTAVIVSSDHGGKSTTPIEDNKPLEVDGVSVVNAPATYVASANEYKSGTPNDYSAYPTSNYPFRQGKTWVYEGGLKVPLIVSIPGVTTAGSVSDAFVHHADLFATFVDLAGGTQSGNSTDSISFMMSTAIPHASAREDMHHFFTNANTGTGNPALGAYRKGDYKLLYFMVQRRVELYNLAADPYEQNDLSRSRPDLAAEMLDAIYQQVLSTGMSMPKPGSNTWTSEQNILVNNGIIPGLPAVPDANPSGLTLTELSPSTIELNWTVNASNATHSVIYRRSPTESNYREHACVPVGTTRFRDTNLTPGGYYRYRVESENLGGWANGNTGNVTLTLSTSGPPLPVNARDDTITTVPGELRCFNPLLNDEGEGELTITSITQPASGSAVIDGGWIRYQAPDSFAGSVTMTYTITDAAAQVDTATVTFTLPVSVSASTVEKWGFDEAANTPFGSTQSNTGLTFSDISPPDSVQTNGAGELVFSQVSTVSNQAKNTTGNVAGGPYTSGRFRMEYKVESLDFDNAATTTDTKIGFSMRDDTSTGAQKDFGLVRFAKSSSTGVDLELQMYDTDKAGGAGFVVQDLLTFNSLNLSNLVVRTTLNMDATPMEIMVELSESGGGFQDLGTYEMENANAVSFDRLKVQSNLAGMASGDSLVLDYLLVEELGTDTTLYDAFASAYPWEGIRERAPEDDADLDGLSNFLEFALGTPPYGANDTTPVVVDIIGGIPVIRFTPVRDTSEIFYDVEFSSDLADWTSIPSVPVVTPAGLPVEEALPAPGSGFARVRVGQ